MAGRKWTEAEIAKLEEWYTSLKVETIARRLDRTVGAVQNMAQKRHMGRARPADVFSMHEFMQILDMDSHATVRRWVREGSLKASRKATYGNRSRPEWWIREKDMIAFLRQRPEQVPDIAKVQMPYRLAAGPRWITFVEAFRRGAAWPFFLENAAKAGLLPEAKKRGGTGTVWAIPETLLPSLIEARRRMTSDQAHRGMIMRYNNQQVKGNVKRRLSYLNSVAREKAS